MIQELLQSLIVTAVAVTIGTMIGSKIVKRDLKKEISGYLRNELPHLLASPNVEFHIRRLAHILFQEAIDVILEEPEDAEEVKNRAVHEKSRRGAHRRSKLRSG